MSDFSRTVSGFHLPSLNSVGLFTVFFTTFLITTSSSFPVFFFMVEIYSGSDILGASFLFTPTSITTSCSFSSSLTNFVGSFFFLTDCVLLIFRTVFGFKSYCIGITSSDSEAESSYSSPSCFITPSTISGINFLSFYASTLVILTPFSANFLAFISYKI